MRPLPAEYLLLKRVGEALGELLSSCERKEVLRLCDLYAYVSHKKEFREKFPDSVSFSRFMRSMYDRGILKSIIKNCHVDTSIRSRYQWYFYPSGYKVYAEKSPLEKNVAQTVPVTPELSEEGRRFVATNGVGVRSMQELFIYNKLLAVGFFAVFYERPFVIGRHRFHPDFTIYNKLTGGVFYWEHFGMTENPLYSERMESKLSEYRRCGYVDIYEGGTLAVTVYHDEAQFAASVDKTILEMMK